MGSRYIPTKVRVLVLSVLFAHCGAGQAVAASYTVSSNPTSLGSVCVFAIVVPSNEPNIAHVSVMHLGGTAVFGLNETIVPVSGAGTYTINKTAVANGTGSYRVSQYTSQFSGAYGGVASPGAQDFTVQTAPPVASFTRSPAAGDKPLPVAFTSTSSGNPTSYAWNFGDGATATGSTANHTYTAYGVYTITLTVSNAYGSDSETGSVTCAFQPPNDPPYAVAVGSVWTKIGAGFNYLLLGLAALLGIALSVKGLVVALRRASNVRTVNKSVSSRKG